MDSIDDAPSPSSSLNKQAPLISNGSASPALSKRFGDLTVADRVSPQRGSSHDPPHQTPSSPRSPVLNRKSSDHSIRPLNRRVSSNNFTAKAAQGTDPSIVSSIEEQPAVTSASLAAQHFKDELARHETPTSITADTVVITHDACYGHRYSRPKTSKATLSMIVERPERLQAGVLGLAFAYVRLGGRHAGGAHALGALTDKDALAPFAIHRTTRAVSLTSPIVTSVHGTKWMPELKAMCEAADVRLASGGKELTRPQTPNGNPETASAKTQLHEGDLYLNSQSLQALEGALGGVCEGVDAVFAADTRKKAFVCIRPPGHHCSADLPSGFCWINNIHVGIEHAIQTHGLTHAAIIDFDLHHGDGSQAIAWERNSKLGKASKGVAKGTHSRRAPIGYFSLHDINSYPCENGELDKIQRASLCIENAHSQSIWNVHLQPWSREEDFWKLYESRYLTLLDKTRTFLQLHHRKLSSHPSGLQSKAAIFISAGFDASEWEMETMQRHKVSVPTEFYARFTSDIVRLAQEDGTGVDGRVVSVLEGGYSDRALTSGVLSHLSGLTSNDEYLADGPQGDASSPHEMQQLPWDPAWWKDDALLELEGLKSPLQPPQPPALVKKPRVIDAPTYQSPTQSFTSKVKDPTKIFRTASGSVTHLPASRPATPPLPEVGWATATFELSKLLLPDRQIDSCRHDELNEPKPKSKRERHSSIGLPSANVPEKRMQLRAKKETGTGTMQTRDQGNRRRTISELPVPPGDEKAEQASTASQEPSAASARPPVKPRQPSAAARGVVVKPSRARRVSSTRDEISNQQYMPAPPVPRVPVQASSRPGSSGSKASSGRAETARPANSDHPNVESVTSGMKKITIKLSHDPTKEQAPAIKKKPARKAPAPRALKSAKQGNGEIKSTNPQLTPPVSMAEGGLIEPIVDEKAIDAASPLHIDQLVHDHGTKHEPGLHGVRDRVPPKQVVYEDDQMPPQGKPNIDSSTSQIRDPNIGDGVNLTDGAAEFVQYAPGQHTQSNHNASNGIATQRQDLIWLPPNVNTPVHAAGKKGKENLPNFSATGPIPFSLQKGEGLSTSPKDAHVAERAQCMDDSAPLAEQQTQAMAEMNNTSNNHISSKANSGFDEARKEDGTNIWDVPETPQRVS